MTAGRKLTKCKGCGRPFLRVRQPYCIDCLHRLDEEFERVQRFLRDNPSSDVATVSRETGVSAASIMSFLRDGRLDTATCSMGMLLNCQSCGKPIKTGLHCDECARKVADRMAAVRHASQEPDPADPGDRARSVPGPGQVADEEGGEGTLQKPRTGFFTQRKKDGAGTSG